MSGEINTLSFPGLGINEFSVNTVAFTIFGKDVMWYGIIVTMGIIAAFLYTMYRSKNEKIISDDVLDYAIFCVIFGIIGARLYYVLTNLDYYVIEGSFTKTFMKMISVWEGGLAIYGGLIAGCITLVIVSKVKKIKVGKAVDMIAPGVMLGQAIGRYGNFVNAEAYGTETTLPWRMGILQSSGETIYVHPTFLYESLWNLLGFILINSFYKKKKYDGQIFLMYISWYGFGRMFIEGLRTDSLWIGDFRISQLVGFFSFFFGTALLIALRIAKYGRHSKPVLASGADNQTDADDKNNKSKSDSDKQEDTKDTVARDKIGNRGDGKEKPAQIDHKPE